MNQLTGLGRLAILLVVLAFTVAVLTGSMIPGFIGLALLGCLEGARRNTYQSEVEVQRDLPPRLRVQEECEIRVHGTTPTGLPLKLRAPEIPGFEITSEELKVARGSCELRVRGIPEATGKLTWPGVEVELQDRWGLWNVSWNVLEKSVSEVAPEPEWAVRGRAIGRRGRVKATVNSAKGFEPKPEIEHVRIYEPGDRVRDIDWKRSSRMPEWWTRQRQQAAPRPIIVLLDATSSMRVLGNHNKLATASRIATGVAAAGEAAGVKAGVVAFHEDGLEHDPDLSAPVGGGAVLSRLAKLPPPTGVRWVDQPAEEQVESVQLLDVAEQKFLQKVAIFRPVLASTPWQAALGLLTSRSSVPAFVVMIIDGEIRPKQTITMAKRLQRRGMGVAVVVMATGAHYVSRGDVKGIIGPRLRQAMVHRKEIAHALEPARVPVFAAGPENIDEVVAEVIASAR